MKKIYLFLAILLGSGSLVSCGDGIDLPPITVETDLEKIPLPENDKDKFMEIALKGEDVPMRHDGAYYTQEDIDRILLNQQNEPWKTSLEKLRANRHANLSYQGNPQTSIRRGVSGDENYTVAMNDVAAAFQLGLRYRLGDGDEYADKALGILKGWASTCTLVTGNTNQALAFGLYGYEFAVAGEQLRDYWLAKDADGFAAYQKWMVDLFYPGNHDFLINHFGTPPLHYWANWGLCNLASMLSIGILADRRDIYNEAIEHLQIGETSGNLNNAIYHVFDGEYANFAQWQENGRDAGHTYLCQGLTAAICQITWNQGDDFFAYNDNMFLKACEYNGRHHVAGLYVPYETYIREFKGNWGVDYEEYPTIAPSSGAGGPIWAIAYYHYAKVKGVDPEKCKYTEMGMNASLPELGGGYYGGNSGGFDQLGWGTLIATR